MSISHLIERCIKTNDERFVGTLFWSISKIKLKCEQRCWLWSQPIAIAICSCYLKHQSMPTFNSNCLVVSVWDLNANVRSSNPRMRKIFTQITKTGQSPPPPNTPVSGTPEAGGGWKEEHIYPYIALFYHEKFQPDRTTGCWENKVSKNLCDLHLEHFQWVVDLVSNFLVNSKPSIISKGQFFWVTPHLMSDMMLLQKYFRRKMIKFHVFHKFWCIQISTGLNTYQVGSNPQKSVHLLIILRSFTVHNLLTLN